MEMASINPSYSRVRLGFGLRPVYWVCLGLTWRATPAPNKNPRRGNLPSPWSSALLAAWRGWRVGHPSPGIRKNSELCDIDWWFWTITLIIPFNTNMMELPWFLDFQRFWMSAKKGTRFDANGKKGPPGRCQSAPLSMPMAVLRVRWRLPDLLFTGEDSPLHRRLYIIYRMLSEAITLPGRMLMVKDGEAHSPQKNTYFENYNVGPPSYKMVYKPHEYYSYRYHKP